MAPCKLAYYYYYYLLLTGVILGARCQKFMKCIWHCDISPVIDLSSPVYVCRSAEARCGVSIDGPPSESYWYALQPQRAVCATSWTRLCARLWNRRNAWWGWQSHWGRSVCCVNELVFYCYGLLLCSFNSVLWGSCLADREVHLSRKHLLHQSIKELAWAGVTLEK